MLTFGQEELDDLLEVKDEIIYHYTSFSVLPEFLKDDAELYCTTSEVLNDSLEILFGATMFADYLHKNGKVDARRLETMKRQIHESIEKRWIDTWVMSLSSKGDDLAQWRGYVPGAQGGYAIGFNVSKLRDALVKITGVAKLKNTVSIPLLMKCWYSKESKANIESLFDFQYNENRDAFDIYAKSSSEALTDDVVSPVMSTIIPTCMHIKHEGFKDESESRIVISPRSLEEYSSVKIVGGKARLPVGFNVIDTKVRDCIDEIIVSPHGNQASLFSQVSWLKRKSSLSFAVRRSDIPYDPSR